MSETDLEMHEHEVDAVSSVIGSSNILSCFFAQGWSFRGCPASCDDMDAPSPHPMIKDVVAPSPKKAANAAPKKSKRKRKKKSSLKPKAKGGRKRKERSGKDEKTEKEQVHKERKGAKKRKAAQRDEEAKKAVKLQIEMKVETSSRKQRMDDEFAREQGIKKGAITPRAPAPKRAVKPAKIVDELLTLLRNESKVQSQCVGIAFIVLAESKAVAAAAAETTEPLPAVPDFKDPTTVEALQKAQDEASALYRELVKTLPKVYIEQMAISADAKQQGFHHDASGKSFIC